MGFVASDQVEAGWLAGSRDIKKSVILNVCLH